MLYISNAFALSMLDRQGDCRTPKPISIEEVRDSLKKNEFVSIVGHADTATILGNMLGVELSFNRVSVKLKDDDSLIVGQYVGHRLPEGATMLPEGSSIEWWVI